MLRFAREIGCVETNIDDAKVSFVVKDFFLNHSKSLVDAFNFLKRIPRTQKCVFTRNDWYTRFYSYHQESHWYI